MTAPGIRAIASYLPAGRLTNPEIIARFGFEEAFLSSKLGIETRPRAGDGETTLDMCAAAAAALIGREQVDPGRIGALVVVTQSPDRILPQTSSQLQGRLGLPKATAALDVGLGCSGFVYGLSLLSAFMDANDISDGMLVTCDRYSSFMDPQDRNTVPLFGDAATATWLSSDKPRYRLGRFSFGTDGSRSEAVTAGGGQGQPLRMDGRAIFALMMSEVPGDIAACLKRNELEACDIDCWIFHQASSYMIDALAQRIGIPLDKVGKALKDCGNTTSSTIPIALERLCLAAPSPPRTVLISGFGVGASWASAVLQHM